MKHLSNYSNYTLNEAKAAQKTVMSVAKEIVSEKDQAKREELIEEFKELFAQKHGSAMDIWMGDDEAKDLAKLYASDKYIWKVFTVEGSSDKEDNEDIVDKKTDKLKSQGWKIWATEENDDTTEFICQKKKA